MTTTDQPTDQPPLNAYEQRQQDRRDRLNACAERLRAEANQRAERAHARQQMIPFGQPILVGHHSERADRSFRGKIERDYLKAAELDRAAQDAEDAAASVGRAGISSDDPDAPDKLRARIDELERQQARMVAANKLVRKQDRAGLAAMGYSDDEITKLITPDFTRQVGYPRWALSNNNANIRRLQERLTTVERRAQQAAQIAATAPITSGQTTITVADNRVCITYPGKPDDATRTTLKQHGFKWSPTRGAWVRMFTPSALQIARTITGADKEQHGH